jgi:hypothetical protein
MSKISYSVIFAWVLSVGFTHAQELGKVSYKMAHNFGLSVGAASGQFAATVDWSHLHALVKRINALKWAMVFVIQAMLVQR